MTSVDSEGTRHPAGADDPTSTHPVRLRVNGADHTRAFDPRTTLLDALREHFHLTGTKKGCDHGRR
jgi:xanthine dehydrogenase YagT iron-sulfur-binding subunit